MHNLGSQVPTVPTLVWGTHAAYEFKTRDHSWPEHFRSADLKNHNRIAGFQSLAACGHAIVRMASHHNRSIRLSNTKLKATCFKPEGTHPVNGCLSRACGFREEVTEVDSRGQATSSLPLASSCVGDAVVQPAKHSVCKSSFRC